MTYDLELWQVMVLVLAGVVFGLLWGWVITSSCYLEKRASFNVYCRLRYGESPEEFWKRQHPWWDPLPDPRGKGGTP